MDKLIQINIFIFVLYLLYRLVFRMNPSFHWNRVYLLLLIPVSVFFVFLPVLFPHSSEFIPLTLPVFTVIGGGGLGTSIQLVDASMIVFGKSGLSVVWWIYGAISVLLFAHYVFLHLRLRYYLSMERKSRGGNILLIRSDYFTHAFSYFNFLILPKEIETQNDYDLIMKHEQTHIRQGHSFDLLFFQILSVLFWFNPISWLLINEIKMVHEFLADQNVIQQKSIKQQYFNLLLKESMNLQHLYIVNKFNYSPLKFRIMMMKKKKLEAKSKFVYLLILPVLFGMSTMVFGQSVETNKTKKSKVNTVQVIENLQSGNEVFTLVDEPPLFPGGQEALLAFLGKNIKYPKKARKAKVEGIVFVSFVVEKNGVIDNVQIKRGIGGGCDKESVRVIKKMPKWKPGKQGGKKVRVRFTLPINFKLKKEKVYMKAN